MEYQIMLNGMCFLVFSTRAEGDASLRTLSSLRALGVLEHSSEPYLVLVETKTR